MTKSSRSGRARAPVSWPNHWSAARSSGVIVKKEFSESGTGLVTSRKYKNVWFCEENNRWQAWTNCMATKGNGRGPYLGQHSTEILAARAQDRSLLMHCNNVATKHPIILNFPESDYAADEKLRQELTESEFVDLLKKEARECYALVGRTKCMQMFVEEEQVRGNLPRESDQGNTSKKVKSLRQFLMEKLLARPAEPTKDAPMKLTFKREQKKRASITETVDSLVRDQLHLQLLGTLALYHPEVEPYQV